MIKIRFKDKVLSSMLLQTFRTHLPMFSAEEKKNTVVVSGGGNSVVFKISADQITTQEPVFKYDALSLRILIFLVGLPLCGVSFFYFTPAQWLLQVVLPTILILRWFYGYTYKRQMKSFEKSYKFFETVTGILHLSYSGAMEAVK